MGIHRAVAALLFQRLHEDRRQPLVALAAEALDDAGEALLQVGGEGGEALLHAHHTLELAAQIDHVVPEDTLDTLLEGILQPDQRVALHTLVQLQRQGAAADDPPLVLRTNWPTPR